MSTAIVVDQITKSYRLGAIGSGSLQADLSRWWARLRGQPDPLSTVGGTRHHPRLVGNQFWALNDVSFEVQEGDVVGVIGRNGAGKSTLFKILSQVTAPTSGHVKLRGRVASLLEVGTGFHPELSGRDNVFLNGTILGMTKAEIKKNFDAIVAFSECEEFIDTPVKRYSSGMYVRLAFAVAAHLESEILIIDEVLAVGDAEFQKKCLGKMSEIGRQGRTVLFVSHNMPAVVRLCNRAILFRNGEIALQGPVDEVANAYLSVARTATPFREWSDATTAPGNDVVRMMAIRMLDDDRVVSTFDIRKPITVELEYQVLKSGSTLVPNLHFFNSEGTCMFASLDCDRSWLGRSKSKGRYISRCTIPGNFLAEGAITISAAISSHVPSHLIHVWEPDVIEFQVVDYGLGDTSRGEFVGEGFPGVVRPLLPWTTRIDSSREA